MLRAAFGLLLFIVTAGEVTAAKEALLIANADYSHFGKLPNPISDARQLGDVLRQIGFNVQVVENASREGMLDALSSFEERLKASRGIAFFHYGGHGVQVDGRNFLIPADADIPDEKRVATRAVDLEEVMGALDASGSSVNVVVLDACRDNPLPATSTRSATRGLSVVARKPKNSIIVYAAEADNKAMDGLFTPVLARAIASSGEKDISDVMKLVRKEVFDLSGGVQTPGEYTQLFEPVFLNGSNQTTQLAAAPDYSAGPRTIPIMTQSEDFAADKNADLSEVKSYWDHNGSVMGLIPRGNERIFVYVKPRSGLQHLVSPGTILFSGTSDGKSYEGTARRFSRGLPPNLYSVSGPVSKGGRQVVLRGEVISRGLQGGPSKAVNDTLVFDLLSAD